MSFQLFTLATQIYITETFFPVMPLQSSLSQIHAFILHASSDCCLLKSICRKHYKPLHEKFQVFHQNPSPQNLLLTVITTGIHFYDIPQHASPDHPCLESSFRTYHISVPKKVKQSSISVLNNKLNLNSPVCIKSLINKKHYPVRSSD